MKNDKNLYKKQFEIALTMGENNKYFLLGLFLASVGMFISILKNDQFSFLIIAILTLFFITIRGISRGH